MLAYNEIDPAKKAFVFELDNVLFPEKDYLLQVYYLFAHVLEYIETFPPANDLTNFFKKAYENQGADLIFDKAREVFGFDEKYRENFWKLHIEAKLPLRLLLYKEMLTMLQDIVVDRKEIFIVTAGNPLQQLNKIRHIEWHGLEHYLRVYFTDELVPKPAPDTLNQIMEQHKLKPEEMIVFGSTAIDETFAKNATLNFVKVNF